MTQEYIFKISIHNQKNKEYYFKSTSEDNALNAFMSSMPFFKNKDNLNLKIEQLECLDIWAEDAFLPVCDWQYDVSNGDTRSGYWEWVFNQKEMVINESKS